LNGATAPFEYGDVVALLIAERSFGVSDHWRSDDSLIATGANLFCLWQARIQLSSIMRSAATKPSGWSSITWCLASGTSTTGARGPIRDDM
jgi:hypothetical protein